MTRGKQLPTEARQAIINLYNNSNETLTSREIEKMTGVPARQVRSILAEQKCRGTVTTPQRLARQGRPLKLQQCHVDVSSAFPFAIILFTWPSTF